MYLCSELCSKVVLRDGVGIWIGTCIYLSCFHLWQRLVHLSSMFSTIFSISRAFLGDPCTSLWLACLPSTIKVFCTGVGMSFYSCANVSSGHIWSIVYCYGHPATGPDRKNIIKQERVKQKRFTMISLGLKGLS